MEYSNYIKTLDVSFFKFGCGSDRSLDVFEIPQYMISRIMKFKGIRYHDNLYLDVCILNFVPTSGSVKYHQKLIM